MMGKNNQAREHLEPFLDGKPLAIERIKEAWPGLTLIDRAYLVSVLLADWREGSDALRWQHQRDVLLDIGLADDNGYVRYVAAKHVSRPGKDADASDTARWKKIKSDEALIVQSAADEMDDFRLFRDEPDQFWRYPHTKRLALTNLDTNGTYIAKILRYAAKELLPNETVTRYEIADVLLQFLGPDFAGSFAKSEEQIRFSHEPDDMLFLSRTVNELWALIPDIPQLSYILLGCLPEPPYSPIPPEVIGSLSDGQLRYLLRRKDIGLQELRHKVYMESANDLLREAAVSSQDFELLDSYILRLVPDQGEAAESFNKKMTELVMLAHSAVGATLVQMEAICKLINATPSEERHDAVQSGKNFQSARAKRLPADTLAHEILEMYVYDIAEVLSLKADKGEDRHAGTGFTGDFVALPENIKAHIQLVTPHNRWSTFLNLRKAVPLEQWTTIISSLGSSRYLSNIYIDDFDMEEQTSAGAIVGVKPGASQAFDLTSEVQAKVDSMSEFDRAGLSALSSALTKISTQMQDATASTGKEVAGLQKRLTLLFWVLGAVLLLLVFKLW